MKKFIAVFAVVALLGLGFASPAFASDDLNIKVKNDNHAYVKNDVNVKASTGGNDANGGYAGGGAGNGGDVIDSDDDNFGGNGGNAGNGGDGGLIGTGDALVGSLIVNDVNFNDTDIEVDCDCDSDVDDVTVTNNNYAEVGNWVDVYAGTGNNNADGGSAGNNGAGNGGDVIDSDDDNFGGNGGDAGDGGWGGVIVTGDAGAGSEIVNLVNTNITRIRR